MYTTILTLHKQGISQRQIAKLTNTHRGTVSKIINKYVTENIESPQRYIRRSVVEDWHEPIVKLLASKLSNVRIFEKLKEQGFPASYNSLSKYIREHNIKSNTCIRFHTLPGEEAQVDFGDVGKHHDQNGKLRKAYIFNMRLSYSRLDYYEIVFDQKIATWIKCHINAFNYFGGVPQVVKLDNLKAGVLDASFYEPVFQNEYNRLAKHYGCFLSPCRPYQPQEKGKVESGIKYAKYNFFAGRNFSTYNEMAIALNKWLANANERMHGTTKCKPSDLFKEEEAACLIKLPVEEYSMESWYIRIVARDCHITIENNYYSVPAKYVAKEVTISLGTDLVKIYSEDQLIATHIRVKGQGIFTTNTSHYAKEKRYCPGFAEYDERYQTKLASMGSNCATMLVHIQEVHQRDWHRIARGIISLSKLYSDEVIDKACERALHYGITSYSKIKKILENNSYNLPLNEYSDCSHYIHYPLSVPVADKGYKNHKLEVLNANIA